MAAVTTPMKTATRVRCGPRSQRTSKVTPTPATTLLMKATMVAVVVRSEMFAPSWSAGDEGASGQRPRSAAKYSAASGVRVR